VASLLFLPLQRPRKLQRRAGEAPSEAPEAPGAVPGFGHLPLIGLGALGLPNQKQPHERMDELQDVYAEQGVLRLQFGASEVFLLSSPEAVEEALCGKNLKASSSWDTGLRGIVETTCNGAKGWQGLQTLLNVEIFSFD